MLIAPSLRWDITLNCNLSCKHCLRAQDIKHDKSSSLPLNNIRSVIHKLNTENCSRLQLIGGEPLSHPNIELILKLLADKGIPFSIVTNGLLLNSLLINILRSKLNAEIIVSLDGATSINHEQIRGKGTFEPTIASIKRLVRELRGSGNRVSISSTLYSQTLSDISQLVDYAKELEVDKLYINKLENYGRASQCYQEIGVSYETFQLEIGKYFTDHPFQPIEGKPFIVYNFLDTSLRVFLKNCLGIDINIPYQPCRAATELGSIDHEGRLWPCAVFHANVELRNRLSLFFSLSDNSLIYNDFDQIWESESFYFFRHQKLRNLHKSFGNPCKKCLYSNYCEPCFLPYLIDHTFDRRDCMYREKWLQV